MPPFAATGINTGTKCNLFALKMLLVDTVAITFSKKLVWHSNFYHTTTTDPLHPKPKKHIRKKPSTKKPPPSVTMPTKHDSSLHSSAQSGNLEYGKDFLVLVNATEKEIFPPLGRCPTTKDKMASILAQNKLLQEQILAFNQELSPQ
jgi:hypothetical protein